jgi:hypothetical protein
MAKKVEIELDVKGNIVESTANLRKLKAELKNVAAGTAEWNKIKNDIRDIEDALESAGQSSEDFKGLLENAPGPLGVLGGAIKKVELATKSWGAALKATGIGLLVSLIGGLVAAFSQTEGSLKKLEPLLIGLEKIFGGLVEMAMPLVDLVLELGLKALPFVTSAFKNVYSAVFAVFQSLGKLGQAVVKLIKGDFSGAWETAKESVTKFGENFETNQMNFEKGAAKMTKTQKENAAKQKEIDDKRLQEKMKMMEAQDKLDEAQLEKMKAEALAVATTEQQKLDVEMAFAKKSYELRKKDLEDKRSLYKKDTAEYKGYTAELTKLDADYTTTKTANKDKQIELDKKANKDLFDLEIDALELKKAQGTIKENEYQDALYQIKKKYTTDKKELNDIEIAYEQLKTDRKKKLAEDERQIAIMALQNQINDLDKKNALLDFDFQEDLARLQEKRLLADEAQKKELAGVENNEIERNKILQKYADIRKGIDAEEVATTKAALEAKFQLQLTYLQAIQGFGSLLQQIADGNKELAITGLLIEKAAAIASIAVNAKKNFIKDGGIKSPIAWANLAVAGVSAAAVIVSAVQGVNNIKNAGKSGGTMGAGEMPAGNSAASLGRNYEDGGMINGPRHAQGGTLIEAEGGEAVMTRGAVSMFGPLLSTLNQMGGGTSFSSGAVNASRPDAPVTSNPAIAQEPMIMKTYVVTNELTTAAERQARLKDLSTL